MEVKINREIRNYTESMFFGLTLRQFCLGVLGCGWRIFSAETVCWYGNRVVDVHFSGRTLCGAGLH